MNRRKNTKSMWSKFTSPSNHSTTNLLIEPASSTTKLLRGNRSMGGCDNHSYYAATGKDLLFFRKIFPQENWSSAELKRIEFSQQIDRNSFFFLLWNSCNHSRRCTNGIRTRFNIGANDATNLWCLQCGGWTIIAGHIDWHKRSCLIICSDGTDAYTKSIIFSIANHDWGQRTMVSWPTSCSNLRCKRRWKNQLAWG